MKVNFTGIKAASKCRNKNKLKYLVKINPNGRAVLYENFKAN